MGKIFVAGLAAIMIAGCAEVVDFQREGVSADKKEEDLMACRREMARFGGYQAQEAFDNCMAGRGYERQVTGYK